MTTLTMQEYEAAIFGDRFRKLMDLVNFLREFDLSQLTELVAAIERVSKATDFKTQIKAAIDALKALAKMTPTDVDDRLVEMVESVMTDELLDIIARLVSGMMAGGANAQDVTILASDRTVAAQANIPWPFLVQLALQIVQLLENMGVLSLNMAAAPE